MRPKAMTALCWVLVIVFSVLGTEAIAEDWNGIVPCVSTRGDVEKILKKITPASPYRSGSYTYKKLRVHIHYIEQDSMAAEKDVVKRVHVYPYASEPLRNYIKKIPNFRQKFEKIEIDNRVSHVNNLAYYRNQAEGFEISVQKNYKDIEVITGFYYFDPSNDCSKQKASK